MVTVTEVKEMPNAAHLSEWSAKEWETADGKTLIRRSENVWSLSSNSEILMIVGVYKPAVTSVAEVWMLLCSGFNKQLKSNICAVNEYFAELCAIYPHLQVKVEESYGAGRRFAEYMGFRFMERVQMSDGKFYLVYEVRK